MPAEYRPLDHDRLLPNLSAFMTIQSTMSYYICKLFIRTQLTSKLLPVLGSCRTTLPSAAVTIEFTLRPCSLTVLLSANEIQAYSKEMK